MINYIIVVAALAMTAWLIFSTTLRNSSNWQATVTPLASIMGSGFLVSAPLLAGIVGNLAVLFMALLLLLAYAVGSAIRYNIRYFEPIENERGVAQGIALLSRLILVAAYFVSVSYYLQLLAAFILHIAGVENPQTASWLTTALLVLIGTIGAWRGLDQLERVEKYAVSLNLGMIAALLLALLFHNLTLLTDGNWELASLGGVIDLTDMRVLLGLLIVVQGFETSRYLGGSHPPEQRIATMKRAQLLATLIYLPFIGLVTVLFHPGMDASVTEIITLVSPVAVVLPMLLTMTAIGSQFSAAVADVEGATGLIEDLTHKMLPVRAIYLLIMLVTVGLTWGTNVNEIIAYASRAFALFYMLQCLVARQVAKDREQSSGLVWYFSALALVCGLVFLLGLPSE